MKKVLAKCLVLTCLLAPMTPVFANTVQQQQIDLLQQQNALLQQQINVLKQNQTTVQGQVYAQQAPAYAPAPVYTTPVYVQTPTVMYSHPAYAPGPWYGGLAAGYILGNWSHCGHWWGGCHRCR